MAFLSFRIDVFLAGVEEVFEFGFHLEGLFRGEVLAARETSLKIATLEEV